MSSRSILGQLRVGNGLTRTGTDSISLGGTLQALTTINALGGNSLDINGRLLADTAVIDTISVRGLRATNIRATGLATSTDSSLDVLNITPAGDVQRINPTRFTNVIKASNGLKRDGDTIELGGALTQPATTIAGGDNTLTFTSTRTANQTAGFNINANPGTAIPSGNEVFGALTFLQGSDGLTPTGTTETVLRAAVNQAVAAGGANAGHTRAQGSLNQGVASGFGLGTTLNVEQAIGATGLGFYQGATDATQDDYVVGLLGSTISPSSRISAINVEASTAFGNFYRSVGGYFRPTGGTTGNLGVVSQIGGGKNDAWKSTAMNNRNIAVVAINNNAAGANERALYTEGALQLRNVQDIAAVDTVLGMTNSNGDVRRVSTRSILNQLRVGNGLTKVGMDSIRLGGTLNSSTTINTNGFSLNITGPTPAGGSGLNVAVPTEINSTLDVTGNVEIGGTVTATSLSAPAGTTAFVVADDDGVLSLGTNTNGFSNINTNVYTSSASISATDQVVLLNGASGTLGLGAVQNGRKLIINNVSGTTWNLTGTVRDGIATVTTIPSGGKYTIVGVVNGSAPTNAWYIVSGL